MGDLPRENKVTNEQPFDFVGQFLEVLRKPVEADINKQEWDRILNKARFSEQTMESIRKTQEMGDKLVAMAKQAVKPTFIIKRLPGRQEHYRIIFGGCNVSLCDRVIVHPGLNEVSFGVDMYEWRCRGKNYSVDCVSFWEVVFRENGSLVCEMRRSDDELNGWFVFSAQK